MFIATASVVQVERAVKAPVIVSDAQLDFFGDLYLANRSLRARHRSFERFLVYVVRNGALFEKLRHHRSQRSHRATFRPAREEA